MDISMGSTSGLTIGDMSGVGGGCPCSISNSVSGVLIDSGVLKNSVKDSCSGEVGSLPTLSTTYTMICFKNISAQNQCCSSVFSLRSGVFGIGNTSISS